MNKVECKKYIRRAYSQMALQSKSMTPENIAIEMERQINNESKVYIAYAKLAMHNLNKSASSITAKQLASEINCISKVHNQQDVMTKSQNL